MFAGNLGLSPSISSKFALSRSKIVKKSLKPLFFKFKVIQGHWCWYH